MRVAPSTSAYLLSHHAHAHRLLFRPLAGAAPPTPSFLDLGILSVLPLLSRASHLTYYLYWVAAAGGGSVFLLPILDFLRFALLLHLFLFLFLFDNDYCIKYRSIRFSFIHQFPTPLALSHPLFPLRLLPFYPSSSRHTTNLMTPVRLLCHTFPCFCLPPLSPCDIYICDMLLLMYFVGSVISDTRVHAYPWLRPTAARTRRLPDRLYTKPHTVVVALVISTVLCLS